MRARPVILRLSVLMLSALCALAALPADASEEAFTKQGCLDLFAVANKNKGKALFAEEQQRTPLGATDVAPDLRTAASFSAGDENGRAYLSLAHEASDLGDMGFALKVSVPFDKDKSEGVFASRAGVSGDIVLNASMSRYEWRLNISEYADKLCSRCDEKGIKSLKDCRPENPSLANPGDRSFDSEEMQQALYGTVAATGWSLEGSIGRKQRKYFDAAGAELEEDRAAVAVSGTLALHLESTSVFGKLTAKQDYKEKNKAQRCSAIEDTMGLESCKQLPLGRAEEVEGLVASLQGVQELADFAVAPTVQYDFEETDWTVVLPIYLIWQPADKEAKAEEGPRQWIGGLKLAWTSDGDDDFGAAIFISTPLKW
jgi:hypothetical protein